MMTVQIDKKTTTAKEQVFSYRKSLKQNNNSVFDKYIRIERYLNRPLASLLVRAVFRTGITPNQLTFLSFFLGLGAAVSFSAGKSPFFALGGVLIQLSSIVDCSDGMLARSKNLCSDYGSHLDLFLDRIVDLFLIAGIAFGAYLFSKDLTLLVLGLFTAGLYLLQVNLFYIIKSFLGNESRGETGEARALMLFLIFILALFNRMDVIIYALFVQTVINNLYRLVSFIRLGKKRE